MGRSAGSFLMRLSVFLEAALGLQRTWGRQGAPDPLQGSHIAASPRSGCAALPVMSPCEHVHQLSPCLGTGSPLVSAPWDTCTLTLCTSMALCQVCHCPETLPIPPPTPAGRGPSGLHSSAFPVALRSPRHLALVFLVPARSRAVSPGDDLAQMVARPGPTGQRGSLRAFQEAGRQETSIHLLL